MHKKSMQVNEETKLTLIKIFCHCFSQNESYSQPIKQAVTVYQWRIKETWGFQTTLWPIHTDPLLKSHLKIHFKISSLKEKSRNVIVSAYAASFQKYFKE